ncbi:MAG: NusG domain II-containing protein [Coriobacteriales bacterium]|jgi:hypothetical protein|nr:NusG domain II-containing protein [Coriobacteriales bacterium]
MKTGTGQKGRAYTRRNLLLGAGLFAVALLAWGATGLYARGGTGGVVVVTDSEKKKHRFSLDEDARHVIQTALGFNTVRIAGGQVCVESADCPNQNCVEQGEIREPGQTVVCLPHKLVVAIEARDENGARDPNGSNGPADPNGSSDPADSTPPVDTIAG